MVNFLIQTVNGVVKHDFSFTLLESIDFQNWLRNEKIFNVMFTDSVTHPGFIPIGSVEFVTKYLQDYFGLTPKPINIPNELLDFKWTGRSVFNGTEKDIKNKKFVKSNDKIKEFTEICDKAPTGNYQISDVIDIQSEWRGFVYQHNLIGLQNYCGNFDVFPDVDKIKNMIQEYHNQPIAYTLDVGISKGETVIIEVHDFFSCGLYGFSEHTKLPHMFIRWFNEFTNKKQ